MPLYDFYDTRTGDIVELYRTVAERRNVPKHLRPMISSGHGGVDRKLCSEGNPDRAVPRALKQLSNEQVNTMVKESGFSLDHYKRVWEV